MRARKIAIATLAPALGLGTALLCTAAYAQDYQDRAASNDARMTAQQSERSQAATTRMRQRAAVDSNRRTTAGTSATAQAGMGEAPTEAPKYRTGRSPNDNGMVTVQGQAEAQAQPAREAPKYRTGRGPDDNGLVSVQAQTEAQTPERFALERGGAYYNYSPGYGSEQGFGAPMQPAAGSAIEACQMRFRSFDPASGTYMGFDGIRHPCP